VASQSLATNESYFLMDEGDSVSLKFTLDLTAVLPDDRNDLIIQSFGYNPMKKGNKNSCSSFIAYESQLQA